MKTNRYKRAILPVITLMIVLFICGQSALPEHASSLESGWLCKNIINPMLQLLSLGPAEESIVRKAAHVGEFFLLCFCTTVSLRSKPIIAFPLCFAVAFLDETIQILSGRGASIRDVWIDLIGVTVGAALGWAVSKNRVCKESRSRKGNRV